jgi:hypothetical protein
MPPSCRDGSRVRGVVAPSILVNRSLHRSRSLPIHAGIVPLRDKLPRRLRGLLHLGQIPGFNLFLDAPYQSNRLVSPRLCDSGSDACRNHRNRCRHNPNRRRLHFPFPLFPKRVPGSVGSVKTRDPRYNFREGYSVRPGWNFFTRRNKKMIVRALPMILCAESERKRERHPDWEGRVLIPITSPRKGNRYKRQLPEGCRISVDNDRVGLRRTGPIFLIGLIQIHIKKYFYPSPAIRPKGAEVFSGSSAFICPRRPAAPGGP